MTWVGWRQQRTEAVIAAAILAALAAVLIPVGLSMASTYHDHGLSACLGTNPSRTCNDGLQVFMAKFATIGNFIDWVTLVPGVIGILLAAPFVGQLEQGTYRLDWTQSITRGRWLAGKLGIAVVTGLVAMVALTALITWWRVPFVHLQGRVSNSVYDSEGTVTLGYMLFALALSAAVGAVWRRAVPSLVVGFAGYFALRLLVDAWLRQRLVTPLHASWNGLKSNGPDLTHAWVLSEQQVGSPPAPGVCVQHACQPGAGVAASMHAVYIPPSDFWTLQLRETALFTVAGLVLLGITVWWTQRRVA